MDFERCTGCPGGECPGLVQNGLRGQAVGKRIIAANWLGLGDHYLRQGDHNLATTYQTIAVLDSHRADVLEEEALGIKGHCGLVRLAAAVLEANV